MTQNDDLRMKLWKIAVKSLKPEDNYSEEEVIRSISSSTKVSTERSFKGFNLMLDHYLIFNTGCDRYYLAGSTPF